MTDSNKVATPATDDEVRQISWNLRGKPEDGYDLPNIYVFSLIARIDTLTAEVATWKQTAEQRANDCVEYQTEIVRLRPTPSSDLVGAISKVASAKDNEATAYPVWYIVDPKQMFSTRDIGYVCSMITGPFFSRESANATLKALRHHFKNPRVYCDSGGDSPDWVALYKASRSALSGVAKECEWTWDGRRKEWVTACGGRWSYPDKFKHCPDCGLLIPKEVREHSETEARHGK